MLVRVGLGTSPLPNGRVIRLQYTHTRGNGLVNSLYRMLTTWYAIINFAKTRDVNHVMQDQRGTKEHPR